MANWTDETLRLLKGSPTLDAHTIGERLGVEPSDAERILADLEREGRITRDGDRLIVVEPAASQAPPDEPIP